MPWHTVKTGESLESIAAQYPPTDWRLIYKHPANAVLFKGRSQDEINPGEKLFVPQPLQLPKSGALGLQASGFKRIQGFSQVTPEVALKILNNFGKGEYPWRPDLGNFKGSAYFVTEGNPFTGTDATKNVRVEVELILPKDAHVYNEAQLKSYFQQEHSKIQGDAAQMRDLERSYRERLKVPSDRPLNSAQRKGLASRIRGIAELRMWQRIGAEVAQSKAKCAEVLLEPGSDFSKQGSGKFGVVADRTKILLKGNSPQQILRALDALKIGAEPVVQEAAQKLHQKLKWSGRVRSVFRWGGRVFIVVGVAADLYKVIVAEDKVKAVVESAGGWAGASAGAAAFALWWTPVDVAGPVAWAVHGVGTLVAGGVGYWVGSNVTRTIYELVVVEGEQ
ncbi:LysM peptidoglycan-binding domain-containing protein [Pyxidicoccus trucidator]|uniref:LysM peptidoglycan-binding domain-containing protein n=1 Tax=Pyxidicoccus trucidator TaxID=2709662 RepID=UPI0013DC0337|nr:LysM domain-containing protein [Pyxidicoccus trucidator]